MALHVSVGCPPPDPIWLKNDMSASNEELQADIDYLLYGHDTQVEATL